MNLALIGLSIIILAWLIELVFLFKDKKSRKINNYFVIAYIIGVAVLVYDGFSNGLIKMAIAELLTLVLSGSVLFIIKNRK